MNNTSGKKGLYLGIGLNLVSILFAGMSKVLNKFSLSSLSPVVSGIFTSLFAAAFTFILLLIRHHKLTIIKNKLVILLGLTNAIGIILNYVALSTLSPVTVTLIARLYLIYVFALGAIFLKEKITRWDVFAIIICIMGSMLISNDRLQMGDNVVGIICSIFYPMMYAANNVIAKKLVEDNSASDVLFYNHAVSFIFLVIYLLFNLGSIGKITWVGIAFNFGGAFTNGFLSLLLFFASLKFITAGRANIVRALGPIVVVAYSYFFFPVEITLQFIIGTILLIIATIMETVQSAKLEEIKSQQS